MRIPATSRNNPRSSDKNLHGTSQKVSQNPIKIWSGRVPGASRIGPGPIRNTPERRKFKKAIFRAKKSTYHFLKGRFWVDFGSRPGAQNRPKTSPEAKKASLETAPEGIFVANAVFSDFELDLGSILDENSMENLMIFPSRSRFFSNMATLTKHRKLHAKTHFSLFSFFYFCSKK